ncbi:MAG: hypothetical protein ACR2OL_03295 [Anderseniella sp.]
MSVRSEKRRAYDQSWDTWDAETLVSTLADGFVFDDPAMPGPIKKADMAAYMASWRDRVGLLGGTGEIECSDCVEVEQDGAVVSWNWWSFVGTKYEGSAVTRTTDDGVQYERITYYPNTPDFSDVS